MEDMKKHAKNAANFLKSLSEPHRLIILCQLLDGGKNEADLVDTTGIDKESLSQHLSTLRNDELVDFAEDQGIPVYSISNIAAKNIIDVLCNIYKNEE